MDTIKFEILEDGTITIETDAVSGKNHQSADEMLEALAELVGGEVTVKHKTGHAHAHAHHGHSHGLSVGTKQ